MKQEPTVSENTSFRYLKEKDISNPHYQIVCFFCCEENNIESFRFGMIDLIKTACSDQYVGNKDSYYYNQQQFVKLLELAYVLKNGGEDFKLGADHFLYRFSDHPFELYTETKTKPFPALHFRTLSGTELNDIRIFLEELFNYKSLEDWRAILDSFLYCTKGEVKLDDIYDEKVYETVQEAKAIDKKNAAIQFAATSPKSQREISNSPTSVIDASREEQYESNPEEGLIFKTQLLASKKKVALTDPIFKGLKGVKEYKHKGMYKYTTGTSKSIAEANEIRNKLRYEGFSNAFVVPFYNDERINSGKISGVVFFKAKNLDGIAGIRVLIYDSNNTIITATLSEADGTFTVLGLKPGDYTAQLDSEQLEKAQMIPTALVQKFSIANDNGNVKAKLKFILEAKDNKNQQPDEKATANKITSHKGLVFKVQIMASKHRKSFSNSSFKALKGIEIYEHEGLYKYTWGEANTLEEIRKIKRDLQNHGFKNAFIVPFIMR